MTWHWSCLAAAECAVFVNETLRSQGLVDAWIYPESAGRVLTRCEPCNSRHPNPRRCLGWALNLREKPLEFLPRKLGDLTVQVVCSGFFDFRRLRAARDTQMEAAPFRECSASVTIQSLTSADLSRTHLDLANREQYGPVWHLQLGGGRGTLARPYEKEVEALRWPAAPMDFLLFVEVVLFNFYWSSWRELSDTAVWQEWIRRSEDLSLTHYWDHSASYRDRRSSYPSWLAAQCNRTSAWDPRP